MPRLEGLIQSFSRAPVVVSLRDRRHASPSFEPEWY